MKNIHSINDFKKLYEEGDKFSADVSFSDSLIGRGFNGIFKILRKSANKGRLIYFKRKLEDEYIKAILEAVPNKIPIKSKEAVEEEADKIADSIGDGDSLLLELGKELLALPLPKEMEEPNNLTIKQGEEKAIDGESEKKGLPEKPFVFTRYEEWVKVVNSMSKNASEDDVKIIKKIKSELNEILKDIITSIKFYKNDTDYKRFKRKQEEVAIFEKEQKYVSNLISACDVIINKYKVEGEISDEDYTKLIDNVSVDDIQTTKVDTNKPDVQDNKKEDKGKIIPASQSDKLTILDPPPTKTLELPYPEINKDNTIQQQILIIYNKLQTIFKNDPKKLKKLSKIYKIASTKAHPDMGGEQNLEPGEKDLAAEIKIMNPEDPNAQLNDSNRESAKKHYLDRTKKSDVRDPQLLKDFYNKLKTIESILYTFENTNYNNFLIDQKLDEAEMILEKVWTSNKNSKKLNKKLRNNSQKLTGNDKHGDISLERLNDKELKKIFAADPKLIQDATNRVNIEAVKDIEYSARLIYDPNVSISNTLLKNFKNNEADAKQYELFWKKMVAKVKKEFHGLLDLDKVDPIRLVNDEEKLRGGATGKKDNEGNDEIPNMALDIKLKESEATSPELKALGGGTRKPPIVDDDYPPALLQTSITEGKNFGTYYILCNVFKKNGSATLRIHKIYDGKKIHEAGEDKIIKMSNFDEFVVTDLEILNYFQNNGKSVYYERIKGGKDAKPISTISESSTNAIRNTFKVLDFVNDKLRTIKDTVKIPVTKFVEVVNGKVRNQLGSDDHQTEDEMNKIK